MNYDDMCKQGVHLIINIMDGNTTRRIFSVKYLNQLSIIIKSIKTYLCILNNN